MALSKKEQMALADADAVVLTARPGMEQRIIKRVSVRLPSGVREDLRGIRGLLTGAKVIREDGTPVTQEMATAICIKFTYDSLVGLSRHDFKMTIEELVKEVLRAYEREGIEQ